MMIAVRRVFALSARICSRQVQGDSVDSSGSSRALGSFPPAAVKDALAQPHITVRCDLNELIRSHIPDRILYCKEPAGIQLDFSEIMPDDTG